MRRLLPPLVMLSLAALVTACPSSRTPRDPETPGGAEGGCPVCECEQPATDEGDSGSTTKPGTPPEV